MNKAPSDPIPPQPDERESIARLLTAAKLLQQNAIGCATNHHGHDCELNGLPGWLADTKKDIDAAEDAILAMQAERRGATRPTIPTCCVTGAIPGDGGACGDCDPCTLGENMVPDAVKRLIAEKNSLRQRVGELEDQLHEAPAQPVPIAGLEPVAWRFAKRSVWHVTSEHGWADVHGDCVEPLYTRAQLEAHAAEQVRPLVEALEGLIEAVELDADEGLEGIGSYTGARLTDAKNAIRARGQV